MKVINNIGALVCVLVFVGCAAINNRAPFSPREDFIEKLQTFEAPLPFGYEAWPAKERFKIVTPQGGALIMEMFGTSVDRETIKIIILVEIEALNKKERRLWYYTDTETSVKNINDVRSFFYTQYAAEGETKMTWKGFHYTNQVLHVIINKGLQTVLGLSQVQVGEFHILYTMGLFQTMFQVARALEDERIPEHEQPRQEKNL